MEKRLMNATPDQDLDDLRRDAERKQYRRALPKKMGDVLSNLLARKGYARVLSTSAFSAAWQEAAGQRLAAHSRAGDVKRGVLEITVRNSAVLQELTFAKRGLLQRLVALLADQKIKDVRFKVGTLD